MVVPSQIACECTQSSIACVCTQPRIARYSGVVVDDDQVKAWRAMLLAQSRAMRAIERDLEHAGAISLQCYDVLLELNAVPDGLRMQELGMRTVVSRTRVSRIVAELEQQGLVMRVVDPSDG